MAIKNIEQSQLSNASTTTQKRPSIFKRLINAIKNSILSDILFNEEAGQVLSPEELDSETRVIKLAHETETDEKDMWNYERQFNEASSSLESLEKEISKVPEDKKEDTNPFRVDESELSQDNSNNIESAHTTKQKSSLEKDRDL